MEREPLLPHPSPRKQNQATTQPMLCPLPEESVITVPPLSFALPSREFKDMLIFGTTSSCSSNSMDVLKSSLLSPKQTNSDTGDCEKSNLDAAWLIDPTYSASKTNLHRSKTAPAMATINEISHSVSKPPQFTKSSIVRQGAILLIIYLAFGVMIYSCSKDSFTGMETHPVVDALYFCIVTMCTIGYGDITPDSTATKLFSITFVLVGFGFIDILLTGMLSFVLDLQENYLLKSIKSRDAHDSGSYIVDLKKGRMRIRMKVALALGVVFLCIGTGVAFMFFVEELDLVDSLYLSVMSVTTVGYGDRAFNSLSGRIFASIWLLLSTLAVARAFLYLAEARVDKRNRSMAKWVLDQDLTVSQFLAADIDNHGFVTKSEFVVYKLKEMGKVSEKEILLISEQFERLDSSNLGKITLADLMQNHL